MIYFLTNCTNLFMEEKKNQSHKDINLTSKIEKLEK